MSFFGFDPTLPRDRGHNPSAPGFTQAADPFAGLSRQEDDDDALDFEDTYDGLGDQLDETDDALNDDTFGGGHAGGGPKSVGKDFDFFGQTAKVADAIVEEQARFTRQQPVSRVTPTTSHFSQPLSKPARTGYERYKEPEYVPEMQVDPTLWGVAPKRAAPAPAPESPATPGLAPGGRKMMSLEEVEAAMRAQAQKPAPAQPAVQQQAPQPQYTQPPPQQYQTYPQQSQQHSIPVSGPPRDEARATPPVQPTHILQRAQAPPTQPAAPSQPTQILQNPNRYSAEQRPAPAVQHPGHHHGHHSRPSGSRHIITHPQQLAGLSEEERAAFLMEDAKRAKRNHKIFLLSKDNGLMTPQDKNFITRIQLQQLVTATGNPNEHGTDSGLSEDFYYQVHNQIRGGPRQHPGQPLSNFAQTYLFQTGGRHGGMRRQARGGDNHMQRMEQQVQRAVEAAKNKPKNKQLVIEGSLGKISFSNAKTPKPLLNIKRTESGTDAQRPGSAARDRRAHAAGVSGSDRKTVLTDIENVYNTLLLMEDHDRRIPSPLTDDLNPELVGLHMDWRAKAQKLNQQLWQQLKVHEPIGATAVHPFIAFLSFSKGKRAIPRVFRHISPEQQTTILTMIVLHLDQLDVVRQALLMPGDLQLAAGIRENVELFSLNVMPSLFGLLNEAGLDIVTGVLGLILTKNVDLIARTRIGVSMLTMVLSRAELIKQNGSVNDQEWDQWVNTYNSFFDALEPTLPNIFPGTVNTGEDVYVWQFLAAIGIGASPEQQQRLVMAVKDRVMETVALAKTLPPAMSSQRLANVNLFMRSIGLDVELLA
ncbi:topoisomerase II-associated protein-like protein PAT1 [Hyaloscypha variabilis F]|uniref:Topoisomerase II-associated protein-like protein PAT1 n=1 Tax=Hyaloscypha variabilis (strain UAMH 11265 / GT02V1 / F) TaxID=1149755 RepID=A0A2J6RC98_HYAVF|nr:topoisomerase II-associated protein-like protein PAT1 [Hyaloscypha variabilis F]